MAGGGHRRTKTHPIRKRGDHQDRANATDLLDYISASQPALQARLKLAYAEARDLVECRWEWIEAVAKALLQGKRLTKRKVGEIISRTTASGSRGNRAIVSGQFPRFGRDKERCLKKGATRSSLTRSLVTPTVVRCRYGQCDQWFASLINRATFKSGPTGSTKTIWFALKYMRSGPCRSFSRFTSMLVTCLLSGSVLLTM